MEDEVYRTNYVPRQRFLYIPDDYDVISVQPGDDDSDAIYSISEGEDEQMIGGGPETIYTSATLEQQIAPDVQLQFSLQYCFNSGVISVQPNSCSSRISCRDVKDIIKFVTSTME
ncbi:hypothetical protein LOK49_LG13G00722 [Camellia lanceoleosa]|uniref:Uncharacterized protein n=1 Tax=Camellia lanceoleosa TaxID=1840588 RepID=A0ACC0FKA1_9ERIC|nr:hypothetical protein LOK49_LG13G00722 [Camellia lanceoleosa]